MTAGRLGPCDVSGRPRRRRDVVRAVDGPTPSPSSRASSARTSPPSRSATRRLVVPAPAQRQGRRLAPGRPAPATTTVRARRRRRVRRAGWSPGCERFLLRTKADIEPLDWTAVAVRRSAAPSRRSTGVPTRAGRASTAPTCSAPSSAACPPASPRCADSTSRPTRRLRIECGRARPWAPSSTEDDHPRRAGPWVIDASVSFTKGCFTGQELVARIDSRGGNVPRHLRGVVLGTDGLPPAPAPSRPRRRARGRASSPARPSSARRAPSPSPYVHRSVEPPGRRPRSTARPRRVEALPLVGPDGV